MTYPDGSPETLDEAFQMVSAEVNRRIAATGLSDIEYTCLLNNCAPENIWTPTIKEPEDEDDEG